MQDPLCVCDYTILYTYIFYDSSRSMFQNHDSGTLCLVFHQEVYDSDTGEAYSCLYHSYSGFVGACWVKD